MTGTAAGERPWETLEETELVRPRWQGSQGPAWGSLGVTADPHMSLSLLGSPGAPCEQRRVTMQTAAKTAVGEDMGE